MSKIISANIQRKTKIEVSDLSSQMRKFIIPAALVVGGAVLARLFLQYRRQNSGSLKGTTRSERSAIKKEAAQKLDKIWSDSSKDCVDEASIESFPASDAPAYGKGSH